MITRLAAITCAAAFLFGTLQQDRFKGLHQVESYEIRPGIVILPSYSSDGMVCSIAVEKRHVSAKAIDVDGEMSEQQLLAIFDEMAPAADRGRQLIFENGGSLTSTAGPSVVTVVDYENVTLSMVGRSKKDKGEGYVAAVIQWKTSSCKKD